MPTQPQRPSVMTPEQARVFWHLCTSGDETGRVGVLRADWFDQGYYYVGADRVVVLGVREFPPDPRVKAARQYLTSDPQRAESWRNALREGRTPENLPEYRVGAPDNTAVPANPAATWTAPVRDR